MSLQEVNYKNRVHRRKSSQGPIADYVLVLLGLGNKCKMVGADSPENLGC